MSAIVDPELKASAPASVTAMSLGSLYGGLCFGPVNTAAVHALAYPLGGTFKVAHGVANSMLLPYVMEFNRPSCTDRYAGVATAMGVIKPGQLEASGDRRPECGRSRSPRRDRGGSKARSRLRPSGVADAQEIYRKALAGAA